MNKVQGVLLAGILYPEYVLFRANRVWGLYVPPQGGTGQPHAGTSSISAGPEGPALQLRSSQRGLQFIYPRKTALLHGMTRHPRPPSPDGGLTRLTASVAMASTAAPVTPSTSLALANSRSRTLPSPLSSCRLPRWRLNSAMVTLRKGERSSGVSPWTCLPGGHRARRVAVLGGMGGDVSAAPTPSLPSTSGAKAPAAAGTPGCGGGAKVTAEKGHPPGPAATASGGGGGNRQHWGKGYRGPCHRGRGEPGRKPPRCRGETAPNRAPSEPRPAQGQERSGAGPVLSGAPPFRPHSPPRAAGDPHAATHAPQPPGAAPANEGAARRGPAHPRSEAELGSTLPRPTHRLSVTAGAGPDREGGVAGRGAPLPGPATPRPSASSAAMAATGVLPFVRGVDLSGNDFKVRWGERGAPGEGRTTQLQAPSAGRARPRPPQGPVRPGPAPRAQLAPSGPVPWRWVVPPDRGCLCRGSPGP